MKLTKKARLFLKEADRVAPLFPKECVLCKHHNPNHLILINEADSYKILCKKCNASETKIPDSTADSTIEEPVVVQEVATLDQSQDKVEFKPGLGKTKIEKSKKTERSTKIKKERVVKSKKTKKTKEWPDKHAYMETKEWNESWEKEETLHSSNNSLSSVETFTQWNLAYGPAPKGFKGKIWLAESPDPIPIHTYTDEKGVVHEIYHFKISI